MSQPDDIPSAPPAVPVEPSSPPVTPTIDETPPPKDTSTENQLKNLPLMSLLKKCPKMKKNLLILM